MNRFIANGVSTALPILLGALSSYNKGGALSANLRSDATVSGVMLANVVLLNYLSTGEHDKTKVTQLCALFASQHFLSTLRYSMSFSADKDPMLANAINAAALAFAIKAQGVALSDADVKLGETSYDFACYALAFFLKNQFVKPMLASVIPAEYQFATPVLATSASYTMKYIFSNGRNVSATGLLNSMIRGAGNELAYIGVDAYSQDIQSDSLGIDFGNSIRSSGIPELLSDMFDKAVDVVLPR